MNPPSLIEPRHLPDEPSPAEYDALADLFLSGAVPADEPASGRPRLRLAGPEDLAPPPSLPVEAAPPPRAVSARHVEGLLLGNLPVLGAGWVVQYAKHAAESLRAPVALLRLVGGEAWLDLVLPRGTTPRTNSRVGPVGAGTADLPRAIAAAAAETSAWLLRVDDAAEQELLTLPGLTRLTLLTGADTPAVVSSYNTIKRVAEHFGGSGGPDLRLALMGADAVAATTAEQRIRRTAETHLSRPLPPAVRIDRIGACTTQSLYRGPAGEGLHDLLRRAFTTGHAPVHAAPTRRPSPPAVIAAPTLAAEPALDDRPRGGEARTEPGTAARAIDATSLAALVPGLTPLKARCPYAPTLELAADAEGVLHLLAGSQGAGGEGTPDQAVGRLLAVAAWADAHAALLEDACGGLLKGVSARGPVLHAMTADARAARSLLDTGVRVHLLVSSQGVRIAADLN